jgi:tRNA-2-methylthio-N6-dimethylallyladenosine synthase
MKTAFIQTFGCQMNEHDSRRMASILERVGFKMIDEMERADLVLINTCSVRKNPENKVYSLLGRLARIKQKRDEMIIGVAGCVAQQEGEKILKREKAVDLVFGTDSVFHLPRMLAEVEAGKRVVYTEWLPRDRKIQNFIPETEIETGSVEGAKALVAITKGCNNHCSFCIVPTTRGRLVSREKENIISEVKDLIRKGAKEIQLLGQNVNAYQANGTGFYELLSEVSALDGLYRLRFTSPHPNDWNNRLSDLMAERPSIANNIHLPFQVGADRILALMRRGHTATEYLDKIRYLKRVVPDIAISTDVIVGFPGETEAEFEQTLEILSTVRFNLVYAFVYSERPGTRAAEMPDDVPRDVKDDRLQRLLAVQNPIQSTLLDSLVGTSQEILIEGPHERETGAMIGRNGGNTPYTVAGDSLKIGDIVRVHTTGRKKFSLIGEPE